MSHTDTLKKLHTRIIDSRDGYESSHEQVEGTASYGTFFDRMIAQRQQFASRIRGQLEAEGVSMDDDGSILAAAHRTWLSLRDALTGDDAAVYAEIVNGETDLKSLYDDAIQATAGLPGWDFLSQQRAEVAQAIATAEAERQRHAA